MIKSYKQESADKGDVTIQQTTPPRLTLNHQQSYVTPRNDNRTQETEMDCLQLAAIFCCVAIGNGSAVTCTARPAVCVYGKQLTFIQLTSDGRLLIVVVAGHNQCRLLSVAHTTRRHVWKDRDDVNLLVNGSQYLSYALVNLSAFVNVLSYGSPPCTDHGGPGPRAISGGVLTDVAISLSM